MEKNGLDLKRILILLEIIYHLKKKKINKLVEEKSSEIMNLEKKELIPIIWYMSAELKWLA